MRDDDLKRWNEGAPESYLQAKGAYAALAPRAEQLEQMLARVELAVQLPATPPPPWLSAKAWLWLVPVLGLVGMTLFFAPAPRRSESAKPALAKRETVPRREPPAPSTQALPIHVEHESTSAQAKIPKAPRRAQSAAANDPRLELALLDRARRVMATNPARALTLTDEHRRSYRAGQFAEERELLAIEALVGLGQKEAAERRARGFLRAHANSVHAHRLEVILQRDTP